MGVSEKVVSLSLILIHTATVLESVEAIIHAYEP